MLLKIHFQFKTGFFTKLLDMGLIGSKLNPPNRKLISSPDQLLEDIITCNIVCVYFL